VDASLNKFILITVEFLFPHLEMDGSGVPVKLPKQLMDIVRTVHQTKWNLIKTRQEMNRSYKEVCTPVLDKCR
jgi:E3 ubiquitin-protein ligase HERC2